MRLMRHLFVPIFYIAAIVYFCLGCKSNVSTLKNLQISKKDGISLNESIKVGFYKGMIETSVRITEELMIDNMQESEISDTIIIDNKDFEFLISHACFFSTKDIVCSDARIIVQYKDDYICLGDLTYEENKHMSRKDRRRLLYFSFFLKREIGYYNYIAPTDLKYQFELKKYKTPIDYKYIDDNYTTISVTEKIDKIIGEKDLDDFKKIIIMHR